MLRSIGMMVERGPGSKPQAYFDVMRAMLFYIDEFPERLHHPKETELLFPPVARLAPETREAFLVRLSAQGSLREAEVGYRTRDGHERRALAVVERVDFEGEDCLLTQLWRA